MCKMADKYIDFNGAKELIIAIDIKSRSQFRKYIKNEKIINIPMNPEYHYSDEWISFSDFLGLEKKANKNIESLTYEKAKEIVSSILNIEVNNKSKWLLFYENNLHNLLGVPKHPQICYKNKGWVSWSDWLSKISESDPIVITLEELKKVINERKITTRQLYYQISKKIRLPSNPISKFNLNSWKEILCKKEKTADNYLNYKDARYIINNLKLKNQKEWFFLCKTGKIPKNIPKTPNKKYSEWISWNDWLGHNISNHKSFISYDNAKCYLKDIGLTSLNEYYDFIVNNQISFLPLNPILFYKGDYKSSDDYLNFDKRISYGEKKIKKYLEENSINFNHQFKFDDCLYKNKLIFDFYLPDKNICIEFDGRQHFEPIDYFGGINCFNLTVKRDSIKNKYCLHKNIKLIRISYEDINIVYKILELEL